MITDIKDILKYVPLKKDEYEEVVKIFEITPLVNKFLLENTSIIDFNDISKEGKRYIYSSSAFSPSMNPLESYSDDDFEILSENDKDCLYFDKTYISSLKELNKITMGKTSLGFEEMNAFSGLLYSLDKDTFSDSKRSDGIKGLKYLMQINHDLLDPALSNSIISAYLHTLNKYNHNELNENQFYELMLDEVDIKAVQDAYNHTLRAVAKETVNYANTNFIGENKLFMKIESDENNIPYMMLINPNESMRNCIFIGKDEDIFKVKKNTYEIISELYKEIQSVGNTELSSREMMRRDTRINAYFLHENLDQELKTG